MRFICKHVDVKRVGGPVSQSSGLSGPKTPKPVWGDLSGGGLTG